MKYFPLRLIFLLATPLLAQQHTLPIPGIDVALHQGKLAFSLEVTLTLAEASPVQAGVTTAIFEVTAHIDVHNAVIRFEVDDGLRLEGAARRTIELLRAGGTQRFSVQVRLDGRGRARLRVSVTATASPNEGASRLGRTAALYFLVDAEETYVSPGSFYAARLDSVNHAFGGPQPGNVAYEEAQRELRSTRVQATPKKSGQQGVAKVSASVTVSGTLEWTDSAGKLHPIRFADLVIMDEDTGPDDTLAVARTNADGFYSATVQNQTIDNIDIYVLIFAHNHLVDVLPPGKRNAPGKMDKSFNARTTVFSDVAVNAVTINAQVPNTTAAGNAFSIFDGLIVAAQFAEGLLGGPLPVLPVEFPSTANVSQVVGPPDLHMAVIELDKWDWDVLHHEYGHYVGRFHSIDKHPGLDAGNTTSFAHGLLWRLSDKYGKDKGTRLAWAEGWPSFFAISLQQQMNVAAMGVPNAGDLRFQDIDGATVILDYSLEARQGVETMGEDDEVAVQRILWDLYDGDSDTGDEISLGFGAVWNAMLQASPKNLSGFWNAISKGKTLKRQTELGGVFAEWGVAPKQEEPLENQHISLDGGGRAIIQNDGGTVKLKWKKHGGAGDKFKNDKFIVEFYTPDLTFKLHESPELSAPEYTMTEMDWLKFFFSSQTPLGNKVKWIVRGSNKSSPETGAYISPVSTLIGGVDLAFVIDVHSSMGASLNGVKQAAIRILDNNFPEDQRTSLFQLVTFNGGIYTDREPETLWDARIPTNVPNTFFGQVASIFPSGNFDCEQKVGSGYAALASRYLEMAASGTVVFATDRTLFIPPPVGGTLTGVAIGILQSRGVRVHVLLSGPECPKSSVASLNIASATNGEDALQAFALLARETGGSFAYVPEVNSGDPMEEQRYENILFNMAQSSQAPAITVVGPPVAPVGSELSVIVTGAQTSFTSGTTLDFGEGISVTGVKVLSPNSLEARLSIDPGASPGFRDVAAKTMHGSGAEETASGIGAFEVSPAFATPTILSVSPAVATSGETLTLAIDGFNTSFDSTSVLEMGDGISTLTLTVRSATRLEAKILIDKFAPTAFRELGVTTGNEVARTERAGAFMVLQDAIAPAVTAIIPGEADTGKQLDIVITGNNTNFLTGVSILSFSGGGINVLSSTVINATTMLAKIEISAGAQPGLYDVIVTTGSEAAVLPGGFTVNSTATGVSDNDDSLPPADYALAQNYPNPFNPATTFAFSLRKSGKVQLVVFDLAGREVARVVDERMPAGNHNVRWQARGLPSGVYYYKLAAGEFTEVKKLVLLK